LIEIGHLGKTKTLRPENERVKGEESSHTVPSLGWVKTLKRDETTKSGRNGVGNDTRTA